MKATIIFLLCLFLVSVLWGQKANLVSDREESILMLKHGKVATEKATLYELKLNESAYLSPGADCFLVLSPVDPAVPAMKSVRVFKKDGSTLYRVERTKVDMVYIADNGAGVFITVLGMDIAAKVRIDIFDPTGRKTGSVVTPFPRGCKFFPGNTAFGINLRGDAVRVFDISSGKEVFKLPPASTFIPLKDNKTLLVDRSWFALFKSGREVWRRSHSLYYPRLVKAGTGDSKVLVGCHHEVAVVNINDGNIQKKWEAPANFGVISIAASKDFNTFGVGLRSLKGVEMVLLLDMNFQLLEKQEQKVEKPTAIFPQVIVLEKPYPRVFAYGQSWEKTLKRK